MIALYVLAALAGIGFGLLQAGWTAKMVASQDRKGRSALMLIGKLALWAADRRDPEIVVLQPTATIQADRRRNLLARPKLADQLAMVR